ncbi:hypothetical protein JTE90_012198 [Oedothorax gibbosus]|uniref:Uncharacterized protein n=1 Tax=Oedothorax gibbosus TaxID=931172 RepID=A0AAV6VCK7_9ARAC|nr:hypothetical protein JTE90_012198 [Oedothorax gibbosus]
MNRADGSLTVTLLRSKNVTSTTKPLQTCPIVNSPSRRENTMHQSMHDPKQRSNASKLRSTTMVRSIVAT